MVAVHEAPLVLALGLLCGLQLSLRLGRGQLRLISDVREQRALAADARPAEKRHVELEVHIEAEDRGIDAERA
jgi:hypothetical protein